MVENGSDWFRIVRLIASYIHVVYKVDTVKENKTEK